MLGGGLGSGGGHDEGEGFEQKDPAAEIAEKLRELTVSLEKEEEAEKEDIAEVGEDEEEEGFIKSKVRIASPMILLRIFRL